MLKWQVAIIVRGLLLWYITHQTSHNNSLVQTKMSNISRFLSGFGLMWGGRRVTQVVDGMKLYDMLCKNMHVSHQVVGGVWDLDLENNDFPIIATGLLFPVLILPKQSRPGCRHHHLSSPVTNPKYVESLQTLSQPVSVSLWHNQMHFYSRPAGKKCRTCQLKNRTTIDSNEHQEKEHMNKYIIHEEIMWWRLCWSLSEPLLSQYN